MKKLAEYRSLKPLIVLTIAILAIAAQPKVAAARSGCSVVGCLYFCADADVFCSAFGAGCVSSGCSYNSFPPCDLFKNQKVTCGENS